MKHATQYLVGRQTQSGQVLMLFVAFLVVMLLFVGLGLDCRFAYLTKANLSKAVDAAALAGMQTLSQGQSVASTVASNTFALNYGTSGRDAGPVMPSIVFGTDSANNLTLNISATTTINTFFLRVLPSWKTLSVTASAQSVRNRLILSLVLDRSGSMVGDGGSANLPSAVTTFVNYFDDANDHMAMVSFSYAASVDVPMAQPFKSAISTAVANLNFTGWTASEQGLTNGLAQDDTVTIVPGQNVIKVVVFFTDGLANTFNYTFDCGSRNISPERNLWDPVTGAQENTGCTIPGTMPSINGGTFDTSVNCNLENEAQLRAIAISDMARLDGDIVYCVGLGDPTAAGECGNPPINPDFLRRVANDPSSPGFNPNLPSGLALVTYDPSQLQSLFQTIAANISMRLSQ